MSFIAVFAVSLCGLAGLPPWTIAAGTIALSSLSVVRHNQNYERARSSSLANLIDSTLLRSVGNALIASGVAYVGGRVLALY